jgi:hypothetical protein
MNGPNAAAPLDVEMTLARLIWIGPLTVAGSIAAVLAVRFLAVAAVHPEPGFMPLTVTPAIVDTAALVSLAVFVFHQMMAGRPLPRPVLGLLGWRFFASDPVRAYRSIAARVLVVSFLPDIAIVVMQPEKWSYALALAAMHIAAWAVCVSILTGLAPMHISQCLSGGKEGRDASRA